MREIYDVVKAKEARQGKARLKKIEWTKKKRKKLNVCPVNKAESSGKNRGSKGGARLGDTLVPIYLVPKVTTNQAKEEGEQSII